MGVILCRNLGLCYLCRNFRCAALACFHHLCHMLCGFILFHFKPCLLRRNHKSAILPYNGTVNGILIKFLRNLVQLCAQHFRIIAVGQLNIHAILQQFRADLKALRFRAGTPCFVCLLYRILHMVPCADVLKGNVPFLQRVFFAILQCQNLPDNLGFIPFLQLCNSLLLTQSGYILTIDCNALINAFLCQQIQNLSFMYLMIPERSHCHKQNQNTDYHQRLFIVIVCFFILLMVMLLMLARLLLISLLSWSIAFLQLFSPPKMYFMQICLFDTSFVIP